MAAMTNNKAGGGDGWLLQNAGKRKEEYNKLILLKSIFH